jgi:hypothetical protein
LAYQFLYSEVFFSFKDVAKSKNLIQTAQPTPTQSTMAAYPKFGQDHKLQRKDSLQTNFNSETHMRIVKELIFEYFNRLIRLLQEPKVQGVAENSDMQEVLQRIKKLTNHKFLYQDTFPCDKSRSNLSILKEDSSRSLMLSAKGESTRRRLAFGDSAKTSHRGVNSFDEETKMNK